MPKVLLEAKDTASETDTSHAYCSTLLLCSSATRKIATTFATHRRDFHLLLLGERW